MASVSLSSIAPLTHLFKEGTLKASASASSTTTTTSGTLFTNVGHRLSLYRGDITQLHVDAIVNAANETLLGGGGVDGAIHRAAGPKLKEECKSLGGCATGQAKTTKAFQLPSAHVIHTVGPIFAKGRAQESKKQLESCYRRSLEEAVKIKAHSVAFPSISTGVYGYPMDEATDVALETVATFLKSEQGESLQRVIFCVFSERDYNVYLARIPEHIAFSSSSSASD